MDINKKTRVELKNFFKKNAIPTEGNFADFIDAAVNQKDDGLLKPAGDPLSLEAAIDSAKTAIRFYETFAGTTNPSWVVSLAVPGPGTPAFALSDGGGTPRLWIGQTGAVTVPGAVTVGSLTSTGAVTAGSITTTGAVSTGALTVTSLITTGAITAGGLLTANAGISVPGGQTLTVGGTLTANGTFIANGGISANAGINVPGTQTLTVGGTLFANGMITATGVINANGGISTASAVSTGTLTAAGLITASNGLTVPSGKTLTVNGTLTAGITTATSLTVNGNVTITGGGALTAGTINASGLITANVGLSVPIGQPLSAGGALTVAGTTTTNGPLNANGTIAANAGLFVPAGTTVTINGTLTANGGITISASNLSVGGSITADGLTVFGGISAHGGLSVPATGNLSAAGTVLATGGFIAEGGDINLTPIAKTGIRLDKNASQFASPPTIPATVAFDTGVTIQAWIYLYSFDDLARIVEFGNGAPSDNIIFYIYADGSLGAQIYRGTTAGAILKSTVGILPLFTWTHVAMTVDNTGVMKLYKDGALVGSTAALGGNVPLAIQRTSNYLGRSNFSGNPFFNGILTEISIWTGARAVISTALLGNETGLIAYWKTGGVDVCTNPGHIGTLTWFNFARIVSAFNRGNQVTILQEDWASPTLNSPWAELNVTFNPPGYFKDSFNVVHLRGVLAPGASGSVIFSLPAGYRPPFNERFVTSTSASTCGYVEVALGGNVTAFFTSASWITLDGITFRAWP